MDNLLKPTFNLDEKSVIIYKLGVIEAKLDAALDSASKHQINDERIQSDLDKRIKTLETGKARVVGGLAAVTVIFNVAVAFLKSKGLI